MTDITVVQAVYGAFDRLYDPVPQDIDADWILVTDQPVVAGDRRIIVEPRPVMSPRLASRWVKCRPDLYTDAEFIVWLDGQVELTSPGALSWMVESLGMADIAMFAHPFFEWRDEATGAMRSGNFDGHRLREQAASYDCPVGHWAAGISIRRNTAEVRAFGQAWFEEMVRWGTDKDQIALPPLLERFDIDVATLPGTYKRHEYLRVNHHVRTRAEQLRGVGRILRGWVGWTCPFCEATHWPSEKWCRNSWVEPGRRAGCKGSRTRKNTHV